MPRRSILSAAERESLLALPDTKDELIRHYTFSESDLSIIRQRRGPANRLGFAVQLCYLRFPGVILGADEPPFPPLLRLVANQLKVGIESWDEYGQREQTRREHLVELQTVFGFQPFTIGHYRQAVQLLTELAMQTDKGIVLARALIEHLRRQSVIVPALNAVERASAEAITRANRRLYDALAEPLTDVHRRRLDDLLKRRDNGKTTWLAWLRQSPVKPNSRHMLEHIERLKAWQALDLPSGIERLVHQNRLLKIAREGGQMTPADLAKFEPQRRYATLVALAIEGMATVTDEIIDLHDRILGKLFNAAKNKHQQQFQASGKAINAKVRLFGRIGQALIEAKQAGREVIIDAAGVVHSPARLLRQAGINVKAKDIRARLADLADLPTVDQAKEMQRQHQAAAGERAREQRGPQATSRPADRARPNTEQMAEARAARRAEGIRKREELRQAWRAERKAEFDTARNSLWEQYQQTRAANRDGRKTERADRWAMEKEVRDREADRLKADLRRQRGIIRALVPVPLLRGLALYAHKKLVADEKWAELKAKQADRWKTQTGVVGRVPPWKQWVAGLAVVGDPRAKTVADLWGRLDKSAIKEARAAQVREAQAWRDQGDRADRLAADHVREAAAWATTSRAGQVREAQAWAEPPAGSVAAKIEEARQWAAATRTAIRERLEWAGIISTTEKDHERSATGAIARLREALGHPARGDRRPDARDQGSVDAQGERRAEQARPDLGTSGAIGRGTGADAPEPKADHGAPRDRRGRSAGAQLAAGRSAGAGRDQRGVDGAVPATADRGVITLRNLDTRGLSAEAKAALKAEYGLKWDRDGKVWQMPAAHPRAAEAKARWAETPEQWVERQTAELRARGANRPPEAEWAAQPRQEAQEGQKPPPAPEPPAPAPAPAPAQDATRPPTLAEMQAAALDAARRQREAREAAQRAAIERLAQLRQDAQDGEKPPPAPEPPAPILPPTAPAWKPGQAVKFKPSYTPEARARIRAAVAAAPTADLAASLVASRGAERIARQRPMQADQAPAYAGGAELVREELQGRWRAAAQQLRTIDFVTARDAQIDALRAEQQTAAAALAADRHGLSGLTQAEQDALARHAEQAEQEQRRQRQKDRDRGFDISD